MENACFCGGEFAPAIFAADSKRSMPKPLGVLQTSARDFRQLLLCNLLEVVTSSRAHCTCTEGRDTSVPGFPSRFPRPEGTLLALLDLRASKNVSIAVVGTSRTSGAGTAGHAAHKRGGAGREDHRAPQPAHRRPALRARRFFAHGGK